jgi:hypothetical protein
VHMAFVNHFQVRGRECGLERGLNSFTSGHGFSLGLVRVGRGRAVNGDGASRIDSAASGPEARASSIGRLVSGEVFMIVERPDAVTLLPRPLGSLEPRNNR